MSRGRPRHQHSRRRAYSPRQREVRERRVRLAREDEDWSTASLPAIEVEAAPDGDQPAWTLRLPGRATAA